MRSSFDLIFFGVFGILTEKVVQIDLVNRRCPPFGGSNQCECFVYLFREIKMNISVFWGKMSEMDFDLRIA